MKKNLSIGLILLPLFFLTACGITEELEQAKESVTVIKASLTEQKSSYQVLSDLLAEIPEAFSTDLEEEPETGLFPDETGLVYDNVQNRSELITTMEAQQKILNKQKKELNRIAKKRGADVDNEQLLLIDRSLDIVISNFDSLKVYADTSTRQETEFYEQFPMEKLTEQLSIIQRTYGAMDIVSEEAQANIKYTLSLIKNFEKDAVKSKEKGK